MNIETTIKLAIHLAKAEGVSVHYKHGLIYIALVDASDNELASIGLTPEKAQLLLDDLSKLSGEQDKEE